jgi:hypothetical protein
MAAASMLLDGPDEAPLTVALAHGAGAPMDSPFMAFFAEGLARHRFGVARFEFPYMAARRTGAKPRKSSGRTERQNWDEAFAAFMIHEHVW